MSLYALFARLFPLVVQTIMRRLLEQQQRQAAQDAASSTITTTPYRDGFDASGVPVSVDVSATTSAPLDKSKD